MPETTVTTDDRGEVHFSIPTAEMESYGAMTFEAAVPSRALTLRRNLAVATRGFSIGLETDRPLHVTGETFDVRLTTHDAADKPKRGKARSEGLPARANRRNHARGTG